MKKQPDPNAFLYIAGLVMAAAMYWLVWFFSMGIRPPVPLS